MGNLNPLHFPFHLMPEKSKEKSAIVRFLTGRHRGQVESLEDKTLLLISRGTGELTVTPPNGHDLDQCLAILHRHERSYELEVGAERDIWINGERETGSRLLNDGDLVEFGPVGPLLRFRLLDPGTIPAKSLKEAFSDCVENAKLTGGSRMGRTRRFLTGFLHDLATETTARFRLWTLIVISLLILITVLLVGTNIRFQKTLREESVKIESIARILEQSRSQAMNREDFDRVRAELEEALSQTTVRVGQLEERSASIERMLATSSDSVAFVQGEYGYKDEDSNQFLRYIQSPAGGYLFTLEEIGNKVIIPYSGTAFQIESDGLLLTNRHITQPWTMSTAAKPVTSFNLVPVITRMRVFWPENPSPSSVVPLHTSDNFDLALLKPESTPESSSPLVIETRIPKPGEEVLLIGYPLGLSGITARTTSDWATTSEQLKSLDFWGLADQLAEKEFITPLTSRGIVSQITGEYLVYDAQTAMGGSGGPVLSLEGKVLAINTAILGGYGGSNLGVSAKNVSVFLNSIEKEASQ